MEIINKPSQSQTQIPLSPQIRVIGLGGAGCNTIHRLTRLKIPAIELIAVNTDSQSLDRIQADNKLLIGSNLTRGFGAGGHAQIGKQAAEENFRDLLHAIKGSDFLFLTAGMGGGTGSGAIQVAARMARSMDIPTIGLVTLPFSFESGQRSLYAIESTYCLQPFLDTLITIPNDRLLSLCTPHTRLDAALALADEILIQAILGINGLINHQGQLDIDLSHILRLMRMKGGTYISTGYGYGKGKILQAIQKSLTHPLLEGISIQDAKGIIIKINGDVSIAEIAQAMDHLKSITSDVIEIIPAVFNSEEKTEQVHIMLLASGIGAQPIALPEKIGSELKTLSNSPTDSAIQDLSSQEKIIKQDSREDLSIPAFIRRGYNLEMIGQPQHANRNS